MVSTIKKAPEEVSSEDEWDVLATVTIASAYDAEGADEPEEKIDFKSRFFDEPIEKSIRVISCTMADEEKPQERAKMEAITKEGDDVEMTHRSVVVAKKTEGREFVQGDVTCYVIHREEMETRRRQVAMQCEEKILELSLLKNIILKKKTIKNVRATSSIESLETKQEA
jgi:hypothetical protein